MYKGFLPSDKNIPKSKIKDLYSQEQIKGHLGDYVGVLGDKFIMLDFDSKHVSEKILKLIEGEKLRCNILETDRGIHVYFLNTSIKQNKIKIRNYIGLEMDVKLGSKKTVEPLVKNGKKRKWLKWLGEEIEELPFYLEPFKRAKDLAASDTRNSDLFGYILPLQGEGLGKEQIELIIRLINTYILDKKLDKSELDVILRAEAFSKPTFFVKNKFQHHVFAKWLMGEKKICKIDYLLHFYENEEYNNITKIYRPMLDELPQLKRAERMEVFHYLNDFIIESKNEAEPKYINCQNGIYNIETDELIPHSSDILITNKIPTKYNPESKVPEADKVMKNIACGNKDLVLLLYEMIGYTLYRRNELGKCFILVGDGANGKSTLLEMIKNLLGANNTSAVSLENTMHRFRAIDVVGKLANLGDDIGDSYIDHNEDFKNMVTGSPVQFEPKGIPPFTRAIYTKFIYCCNSLPRFKDTSFGLSRRLCIVPLRADFTKGNYTPFIIDKLKTKEALEYLLLKSIEGLKRVIKNNGFTEVDEIKEETKKYEEMNNSVLGYLAEGGKFENEGINESYRLYSVWCRENNLFPLSKNKVSRELKKRFNMESSILRINGKIFRIYKKEEN